MKIGDTLYLVYDDTRKKPINVTVKSIGRKYITVDGVHACESRYDILTKRSVNDNTGWNCCATLYTSKEQYNKAAYQKLIANEYRLRIIYMLQHGRVPDSMILDIANQLGIKF